jgi:hypothetical protein
MDMTTTEKNWLKQVTTSAREACMDVLRLRKRDYEGWEPPEVVRAREENKRLHEKVKEHGEDINAIKRGIMNIAGWFGKKNN